MTFDQFIAYMEAGKLTPTEWLLVGLWWMQVMLYVFAPTVGEITKAVKKAIK